MNERTWPDNVRLDDLGLDTLQKIAVLEWFARKVWFCSTVGVMGDEADWHSKNYDPLTVEIQSNGSGTAHSYVFNFKDGGRHHFFESLTQLEEWLTDELTEGFRWAKTHDMPAESTEQQLVDMREALAEAGSLMPDPMHPQFPKQFVDRQARALAIIDAAVSPADTAEVE